MLINTALTSPGTRDRLTELHLKLWSDLERIHALADDDDRIAQFLAGLHMLLCNPDDKGEGIRLLQESAASMWYPAFITLTLHFRFEGDENNANRYASWAAEQGQPLAWALDYSKCSDVAQLPFAKYRFNEAVDRYTRFQQSQTLRPDEEFAADLLLARYLLATWRVERQLNYSHIERLQAVSGTHHLPFTRYVAFRAIAHDKPKLQPDWIADLLPFHAPIHTAYREVFYEIGCKAFHEGSDKTKEIWKIAEQLGDPLAQRVLKEFDLQHGRPLNTERRGLLSIKIPEIGFDDIDWSALYQAALDQTPDVPFPSIPHWHLTDWIREHLHLRRRKH